MFGELEMKANTFNFTDLHGKTLEIIVGESYDDLWGEHTTVVWGYDKETDVIYVLHFETKREVKNHAS